MSKLRVIDEWPLFHAAKRRVLNSEGLDTMLANNVFHFRIKLMHLKLDLITFVFDISGLNRSVVLSYIWQTPDLAAFKLLVISGLSDSELVTVKVSAADKFQHNLLKIIT